MIKFNKGCQLKIVCIALGATLLFTNALYPSPSQEESLRFRVGAEDTYRRINEAYALSISNYYNFKQWLKNIPQDKLDNTIVFLDALETLLKGLTDSDSDMRNARAGALKAMIDAGLVNKEEAIKEVKEKNILTTFLKGLTDSDSDVHRVHAQALKILIDLGLVSKEEAIKELNEKNVLQTILKNLVGSTYNMRKANAETLEILINAGLVSKEKAEENTILEILLKGLADSNIDLRMANAKALKALINTDLASKEEAIKKAKESHALRTIFKDLADPDNSGLRMESAGALKILIDMGLASKEEAMKEVKEKNILGVMFKGLADLDNYDRRINAETLEILINAGLVSKEEAIKEVKEKNVLEVVLKGLADLEGHVRRENAVTLRILIDLGLLNNEEVKEKNALEAVLKNRTDSNSDVRRESAKALEALVNTGLLSKEKVIKEATLSFLKGLYSWNSYHVRSTNAQALKALIDAGLVSKEEVIEKNILETLLEGLAYTNNNVRGAYAQTLKALIDAGLVSKEEAIKKVKENNILEAILEDLVGSASYYVRGENVKALKALLDAGLVSKEEVKDKNILKILLKRLTDPDITMRFVTAEALKILLDTGLESEEERLSSEEIKGMFKKVYGTSIPASGHTHYYLKFLNILKDNPRAAYQIFNWDIEELHGLFRIFDYFTKGAVLDPNYKKEAGKKHSLEQELIKGGIAFFGTPKIFISHLRGKIKTHIKDNSVKLEIYLYEVASVNAARGLIKVFDLDKDNVIILYDKEINAEQAARFFPGYDIRAYKEFTAQGVIDIEFHDYGDMIIKSSDNAISASLPYTPFKFNLPERVPEEELNKMRESLGIGSRKVIVLGSPSDEEFNEFMQSYNELYGKLSYAERPLIIVGFRNRRNNNELKLLSSLSGQSIAVRTDDKAPLPDVKSNNILILNTSGELIKLYGLADVAIVGNDRNIFEPASQKAAILYFDGLWINNKDAKNALVEAGATQIFNKERLKELLNTPDRARKMAADGSEVIEAYRKEVLLAAEEFALQIIGADNTLRAKFLVSSPIRTEEITSNIKNGTPLSPEQLAIMDFDSEEELFVWLNNRISENTQLASELNSSNYPVLHGSGGQSNLKINPKNSDYALKTVVQNFQDMPIAATLDAFKLSQERLGGLVGSFFLPIDFPASHKALVSLAKPLDDQDIRQKGVAFVDEYIKLIESYWKRGVFDHDFKLDGLGVDKQNKLIVIDFGLSEDMLNEGLFVEPAGEAARFWNTFNIGIDKLHNTRDGLNKISPNIGKYFEDQLKSRYQIELLPDWDRDMRGGYEATELAKKLKIAVKTYSPQAIQKHYVFPFIGREFDRFINLQIKERLAQNQSETPPQTLQDIFYGARDIFNSL